MPIAIATMPIAIGSTAVREASGGRASQKASAPSAIPKIPIVFGRVHCTPPMRVVIAVMRFSSAS